MIRSDFDIAVLGGGPAGSATALLLAQAGLSVLLLEASDYRAPRTGETLPPLINQQLKRLRLMQPFIHQGHKRAPGIVSVWGGDEPYVNDFFRGVDGSGWQVDRSAFDRMLAENAARAGATVRLGSRMVTSPRRTKEDWVFESACQGRISTCNCRFLVDATGRSGSSWLSQLSPRVVLDRLIGVVWTGKRRSESPYTVVESVDEGWFYSADLPRGRATVAYMTDSDLYRQGRKQFPDLWRRLLSKTIYARERLSNGGDLSRLRIMSAASTVRASAVGENWCAVGDAALSHDPLSGLGVYQALESAAHAAPDIRQYLEGGKTLSDFSSYRSWVARALDDYLIARRHYYAKESRWPTSPFWRRRMHPETMITISKKNS
jgi:flavin-dependent dehydrogenase